MTLAVYHHYVKDVDVNDVHKYRVFDEYDGETDYISYIGKYGSFNLTNEIYDGVTSYVHVDGEASKAVIPYDQYVSMINGNWNTDTIPTVAQHLMDTVSRVPVKCNRAASSSPTCKAECGARKCGQISSAHNYANSGNKLFICRNGNPDVAPSCDCYASAKAIKKSQALKAASVVLTLSTLQAM